MQYFLLPNFLQKHKNAINYYYAFEMTIGRGMIKNHYISGEAFI